MLQANAKEFQFIFLKGNETDDERQIRVALFPILIPAE